MRSNDDIQIGDKVKCKTITGGGYFGIVVNIEDKGKYYLYTVVNSEGIIRRHSDFDVSKREKQREERGINKENNVQ